jgi:CheY-like chemotaxis protein
MSSIVKPAKLSVLFVDDERRLVEVYADILGDDYDVHIATSGQEALQKLQQMKNVAVVVTDFHMPHMDGATLLHEVMQHSPLATRILLTGSAGIEGARDAVNKGQIFRFLSKPCALADLRGAVDDAVAHYCLLNAERLVMQETLIECISALMEVLAVTNPIAFGRSQRIKNLVQNLAVRLDCAGFWQLEAAALLSQIGYFAANPELAEKMYYGRELSVEEQSRAASIPVHARRLLEHIPRLEPVIQILVALEWTDEQLARAGTRMVGLGARMLSGALEYDTLISKQLSKAQITKTLKDRVARLGTRVLDALCAMVLASEEQGESVTMPLRQAAPGMRLRQEIRTPLGALLVPIGIEVSERLIDRISQIAPALLDEPVQLSRAPRA